jgi:hypothetical protein
MAAEGKSGRRKGGELARKERITNGIEVLEMSATNDEGCSLCVPLALESEVLRPSFGLAWPWSLFGVRHTPSIGRH